MPPYREHPLDSVAEDLFAWMEGEVDYYVGALQGPDQRAPFSAQTSEREKADYYRRQMFQTADDGSILYDKPNGQGRDRLLKRYGTKTYAEIWEAVRPKQGMGAPLEPEPDALEAAMPPMPEDEGEFTG